ncbi:MAG: pantoate--beta-alanine ligase [Calditrichota bacterium]|jgi:pantoate--beta-alanine ligase
MRIIKKIEEMQTVSNSLKQQGKIIGFVPTMGFLHDGHLSLMKIIKPNCDELVVSIFVNPTQFGPGEDFNKYPRDFSRDEELCRTMGVDILFYPSQDEVYVEPYLTFVEVNKLTETMCGISRPGHFKGVTTIVCKLFNIVRPDIAIFGQKDYQQSLIIKQMVEDLNLDIRIIAGPIVREPDGLAMSSRNRYLSRQEHQDALLIYQSLRMAGKMLTSNRSSVEEIRNQISEKIQMGSSIRIDYIAIVDPETLEPLEKLQSHMLIALAVYVGKTRLIDNVLIENSMKN